MKFELNNFLRLRGCIIYIPRLKGFKRLQGQHAVYVESIDDEHGYILLDGHVWRAEKRPLSDDIEEDEDCYYAVEMIKTLTNSKEVA